MTRDDAVASGQCEHGRQLRSVLPYDRSKRTLLVIRANGVPREYNVTFERLEATHAGRLESRDTFYALDWLGYPRNVRCNPSQGETEY